MLRLDDGGLGLGASVGLLCDDGVSLLGADNADGLNHSS